MDKYLQYWEKLIALTTSVVKILNKYLIPVHIFQVFISFNFDDYKWKLMKTPKFSISEN